MPEQKTPDDEVGSAGLESESLTRRERDVLALLAQGYSGPEIAERLTLATSSVKSHVQHLYGKLGVNSKREAVERARELGLLEPGQPVLLTAAPRHTPPLPKLALPVQVTRFFGREDDIARVRERLAEWRLVTLTGSGGVGKTRLSLRAAEEALGEFSDGVWFVALAPLADAGLVGMQVAVSLGIPLGSSLPILEILVNYMRDRALLLVLDNCEHLLAACAQVADTLLHACPRIRILASSREPLGIAGEAVFVVPSLPFPDPGHMSALEKFDDYTALTLFVDRARAVRPGYQLTPHEARFVARICQRLDGIPLALELAAARMNLLTAEQLVGRLDDAFRLLTHGSRTALPRHQTLRATIDWSYQLLDKHERLLLRRLAIFGGGCVMEAAEAICSGEGLESEEVLDLLAVLVSKSMVITDPSPGEEMRYHLLEMVHQYASQKLDEAGERERLSRRHWEYFLQFVETNGRRFLTKERPVWLRRLEAEVDNLRGALQWAFADPAKLEDGVRLLLAMQQAWFLWNRDKTSAWVRKAIDAWRGGASISPALEARFLAWVSTHNTCSQESRTLALQSLAISRTLGPEHNETFCFSLWTGAVRGCYLEILPDDWDRAEALLDEQDAIIPMLGPETLIEPRIYKGYNLWLRAVLANYRGHYERAQAFALESIRLFEASFHELNLVNPYIALGDSALRTGDYDKAHSYLTEALRLARGFPDVREWDVLTLLCETEMRRGDLRRALEYCAYCIRAGGPPHSLERMEMAARIFAKGGRFHTAARLSGAAEALTEYFRACGRTVTPEFSKSYWGDWRTRFADASLDALVPDWRSRSDSETIVRAWNEGRAMSYDETVAFVLSEQAI
jgi:predicted ATPase/DNA-binding CsgD family transcriptional regulator